MGDLKAEWLLLKREVNDVKSENAQLKYGQNDIKDDSIKLKDQIDALQSDTSLLKSEQQEIKSINAKLSRSVNDLKSDGRSREPASDESQVRLNRQISNLKSQNTELQRQIERMRDESAQLKREVLAVALAARNVSQDEIGDILRKLPTIQLPAPPTTPRQRKQGEPEFPRGKIDRD